MIWHVWVRTCICAVCIYVQRIYASNSPKCESRMDMDTDRQGGRLPKKKNRASRRVSLLMRGCNKKCRNHTCILVLRACGKVDFTLYIARVRDPNNKCKYLLNQHARIRTCIHTQLVNKCILRLLDALLSHKSSSELTVWQTADMIVCCISLLLHLVVAESLEIYPHT